MTDQSPIAQAHAAEDIGSNPTANPRFADVLDAPVDEAVLSRVRRDVEALCRRFPVYALPARAVVAA